MTRELLDPKTAYARWAASYDDENVVTTLENEAVRQLTPQLADKRLLDAGCGTGRRLRGLPESTEAVGIDLVAAMLSAGGMQKAAVGDVCALPLRESTFDVVWCRLVLGHLENLDAAYAELARVTRAGGRIVISDFHPEAVRAGHTRSFRSADGGTADVRHYVHEPAAHRQAADQAGLRLLRHVDAAVNAQVRAGYASAGALDKYERDFGLPLVLALSFER
jgi:malonyl-CoA O-methyltransferase